MKKNITTIRLRFHFSEFTIIGREYRVYLRVRELKLFVFSIFSLREKNFHINRFECLRRKFGLFDCLFDSSWLYSVISFINSCIYSTLRYSLQLCSHSVLICIYIVVELLDRSTHTCWIRFSESVYCSQSRLEVYEFALSLATYSKKDAENQDRLDES